MQYAIRYLQERTTYIITCGRHFTNNLQMHYASIPLWSSVKVIIEGAWKYVIWSLYTIWHYSLYFLYFIADIDDIKTAWSLLLKFFVWLLIDIMFFFYHYLSNLPATYLTLINVIPRNKVWRRKHTG